MRTLSAGPVVLTVNDRSRFHNFHLRGPGIDQTTTEDFVGTQTWTVTLADGVFTFQCDPHAAQMNGAFSVGSAQPPPPPAPPAARAKCKVPKVVGKRLAVAKRAITRARCRIGRIRRARSTKARGRVVRQTPRAGAVRTRGARVHLVVSRGQR